MATIIQIKRTTGATLPTTLEQGELAYLYDTSVTDTDAGGNGGRLYIGDPATNTNTPIKIGGSYYTALMDHVHGVATASAGVILDASKKISEWNVDNITINGNAITSTNTNGDITITPAGSGKSVLSNVYIGDDATTLAEYIQDQTGGQIVAGEGIDAVYDDSAGTVTLSGEDATGSNKGIASFNTTDFTVTTGAVTLNAERVEDIVGAQIVTNGSHSNITAAYDDAVDGAIDLSLNDTAVTAGAYGSSSAIPTFTVDAQGRLTAAGTASIATSLTLLDDSGGTDGIDLLTETLLVSEGEGIDVAITANTITISGEDATVTNKGIASFSTNDFSVTAGAVTIKTGGVSDTQLAGGISNAKLTNDGITIGTTDTSLGDTITALAGMTQIDIDNLTLNGNTVSSSDTNGDINLTPNGTGTIIVPSGYEGRAGFNSQSLVNKTYVDQVANGLDVKASVRVATTANLAATYNNGNGTLTANANGAIVVDGVTLTTADRILVKDQTTQTQNGFYKVTTVGSGSAAFVLTRTPDANEASEITGGAFTFVEEGTANADNGYVATHNGVPTLGTTNITFDQFSGAGQISAGAALSKTGNTIDVEVDDSSIQVSGDALQVKALGITNAMLAGSIVNGKLSNSTITISDGSVTNAVDLGDTLSILGGAAITAAVAGDQVTLSADVDGSSIEVSSDALRVKALGITNAMLAGSIANGKLTNSSITVNSTAIALGGSHTFNTDAFAEGSTNVWYTDERVDDRISALFVAGEGIDLTYDDSANTFTVDAELATASNKGVASFAAANFTVTTGVVTVTGIDGGTY
jgi:hypothetical protein